MEYKVLLCSFEGGLDANPDGSGRPHVRVLPCSRQAQIRPFLEVLSLYPASCRCRPPHDKNHMKVSGHLEVLRCLHDHRLTLVG